MMLNMINFLLLSNAMYNSRSMIHQSLSLWGNLKRKVFLGRAYLFLAMRWMKLMWNSCKKSEST